MSPIEYRRSRQHASKCISMRGSTSGDMSDVKWIKACYYSQQAGLSSREVWIWMYTYTPVLYWAGSRKTTRPCPSSEQYCWVEGFLGFGGRLTFIVVMIPSFLQILSPAPSQIDLLFVFPLRKKRIESLRGRKRERSVLTTCIASASWDAFRFNFSRASFSHFRLSSSPAPLSFQTSRVPLP